MVLCYHGTTNLGMSLSYLAGKGCKEPPCVQLRSDLASQSGAKSRHFAL